MKIIKLSQQTDREAWLDARRTMITGSKAKKVKPLTRGADRTPAGFWELLAENMAIAKDGEPEMDRGQRLEKEAIALTAKKLKLNINDDAGLWVSDDNENIGVSPDGAEDVDEPTYAVEAKCLDSKNHLMAIVMDYRAKKTDEYNPFESLKFGTNDFRDQALQYFIVDEVLETLYFTLYDDRMALDNLVHYVITIKRSDVAGMIVERYDEQKSILNDIKMLIKELKNV